MGFNVKALEDRRTHEQVCGDIKNEIIQNVNEMYFDLGFTEKDMERFWKGFNWKNAIEEAKEELKNG
jgi:hypothetical protein